MKLFVQFGLHNKHNTMEEIEQLRAEAAMWKEKYEALVARVKQRDEELRLFKEEAQRKYEEVMRSRAV